MFSETFRWIFKPSGKLRHVDCFTLKMDQLQGSEKSAVFYQSTRRNFRDHQHLFETFRSSDDKHFHIQTPAQYFRRPSGGCSPLLNFASLLYSIQYPNLNLILILFRNFPYWQQRKASQGKVRAVSCSVRNNAILSRLSINYELHCRICVC